MATMGQDFILSRIPHRPPFLWLEAVEEITETSIRATSTVAEDLELFRGHYPHYPIMPGVILCEAVFQAGAVFISEMMHREQGGDAPVDVGVPVLTRILGAKFKREVKPGDAIEIAASLTEKVANAWFMKGSVRVGGKVAVQVEFACAQKGG